MGNNINKQLYDDGAIIGYRPQLEYNKELNDTSKTKRRGETTTESDDNYIFSGCLNGFITNKPSDALKALEYAINNMEMLLDCLTDKFVQERNGENAIYPQNLSELEENYDLNGAGTSISSKNEIENVKNSQYTDPSTYKKQFSAQNKQKNMQKNAKWPKNNDPYVLRSALDAGDTDFVNDFVDYHKYSDDGSIIPELMQNIHGAKENLGHISNNIKEMYYGDVNTDINSAISSDSSYLDTMKNAEKGDFSQIINYPAVFMDSILSKTVQIHAYKDNKDAIEIANVILKRDKGVSLPNNMDLVKHLLDEVNLKLDRRANSYNKIQSIELLQKSLYNYYEKRKYLNDLFELRSTGSSSRSKFINNKIEEYADKTREALRDVNRVFKLEQTHLKEIEKLEREKFYVKTIYNNMGS